MQIGIDPSPGLVRPDYQSARGYRQDVWRGRLWTTVFVLAGVLHCALVLAVAIGTRAEIRRWLVHREQVRAAWVEHRALLADEALCMNYAAPPGQPVYSEGRGEVLAMLRQRDCFPLRWVPPVKMCGGVVSTWPRDYVVRRAPPSDDDDSEVTAAGRLVPSASRYPSEAQTVAFIGRRRNGRGADRLVIVGIYPSHRPASVRGRWLQFTAVSFTPAGPAPGADPVGAATSRLSLPVPPRAYARVLAGQRDPSDPARFSIRYELDDTRGAIAGRLNNNGTVLLETAP